MKNPSQLVAGLTSIANIVRDLASREVSISVAYNRKYCGRLDHLKVGHELNHVQGKASLAEILFQKLFPKRTGCQKRRF